MVTAKNKKTETVAWLSAYAVIGRVMQCRFQPNQYASFSIDQAYACIIRGRERKAMKRYVKVN